MSGCIKCFQQIKMKCFPRFIFLQLNLLYVDQCHTTEQISGRGSRASEGHIYSMCIIAGSCRVFLTVMDALPLLNCPIMHD